ncbi:hypothetical protein A2Y85_00885 [candidate division WOR-3 bacterium RBG_13_43_14]|uniref:Type 4 fimbrial biogenesis protein PilX N-terminal domain-containing protein n=1 Tax=candidate division WOR-3 bacterium RBG_13_43_14 TaxID=1802590 RepID=A0A1F4UB51_UNCW3|nr:MAG: hypothetical protein A2Y85_00885 [candidate division WOR-3 bacterium RBG_13_43_14]
MKNERCSEAKKLRNCAKNPSPNFLASKFPSFNVSRPGIALLVALGTMIVIIIIGSLAIYMITRGLTVTGGQTRYETAYEAGVASLEIGMARAEYLNQNLDLIDTTEFIRVGAYKCTLHVERTSAVAVTMSGTAIKFARGISGPGSTPAFGSYRTYYISAQTIGNTGEQVMLEVLQRFTILAQD